MTIINSPLLKNLLVLEQNTRQNKKGKCVQGFQTPQPPQVRQQRHSQAKVAIKG